MRATDRAMGYGIRRRVSSGEVTTEAGASYRYDRYVISQSLSPSRDLVRVYYQNSLSTPNGRLHDTKHLTEPTINSKSTFGRNSGEDSYLPASTPQRPGLSAVATNHATLQWP